MLIGELAERARTSTRALRYYEAHGLLQAERSANGYRVYDEAEPSPTGRKRADRSHR